MSGIGLCRHPIVARASKRHGTSVPSTRKSTAATAVSHVYKLRHRIICPAQRDRVENYELLAGDGILLVSFCLYKQIATIVTSPTFPGWLAPVHLNPVGFAELLSFFLTLGGCWVTAGLLFGGYLSSATRDVPTALTRTSLMWLCAMPLAACQLVLVTALESRALVGEEGFASVLPLAASGPGEPFVTGAGVLGLMSCWRAYYASHMDFRSFGTISRLDQGWEAQRFQEVLLAILGLAAAEWLGLQLFQSVLQPT